MTDNLITAKEEFDEIIANNIGPSMNLGDEYISWSISDDFQHPTSPFIDWEVKKIKEKGLFQFRMKLNPNGTTEE